MNVENPDFTQKLEGRTGEVGDVGRNIAYSLA